ncbi:hypothetical protein KI387_018670, partial [Taxus chinensis]
VTDTGGGNVATGMYETLGVDEVLFGVVVKGKVDVMGITEIADAAVIAGIEPNYEIVGGKVDTGSTESHGVDAGVGAR